MTPPTESKNQFNELPIKDFSYVNNPDPSLKPPKNRPAKYLLILLLLVLVIGGALAYKLVNDHKSKSKVTKTTTSQSSAQSTSSIGGPTTSYTSTAFSLSVNYPKSWVVNSSNSTSLSFTSPSTTLKSDLGKRTNAKVILTVVPMGQLQSQIASNATVAVLPSQLFTYTNPTPSQAAQAYLSFFQYPSTNVIGGMDAIYITGNLGYVKTQTVVANDIASLNPLVYITFVQCLNQTCSQTKPLTIISSMWNDKTFQSPILNMVESFSFT